MLRRRQSVQLVVRGEVAALPLAGIVDIAAEQARLSKEIHKIEADVAKVDAKLGNADFLARAPQEVDRGAARAPRRSHVARQQAQGSAGAAPGGVGAGLAGTVRVSAECRDAVAACHAVFGGAFTREQPEIFHVPSGCSSME